MKHIILVVCIYSIVVLHSALARDLAVSGFAPHLILAGLVVITVHVSRAQGIFLAALLGLTADCLAEGRLGLNLIGWVIAAAILQRAASPRGVPVPWKLAASSMPLVWGLLFGGQWLGSLADGRNIALAVLAIQSAGAALYTALIVAVAAYAVRMLVPVATEHAAPAGPTVSNTWRMLTE